MKVNKLTKHTTLIEEEFHALVEFKGVEVPFRVLRTTSITKSTCFTAVSVKKVGDKPNLTKGQKEKIRSLIEQKLNIYDYDSKIRI